MTCILSNLIFKFEKLSLYTDWHIKQHIWHSIYFYSYASFYSHLYFSPKMRGRRLNCHLQGHKPDNILHLFFCCWVIFVIVFFLQTMKNFNNQNPNQTVTFRFNKIKNMPSVKIPCLRLNVLARLVVRICNLSDGCTSIAFTHGIKNKALES